MAQLPTVSPDFMATYDHATPSGHRHPACRLNRLANVGIDCRAEVSRDIDLDLLTDRTYTYLCETSDDGWLIGGGDSTKLKRPDTAHAEIWRFGPDNEADGGIAFQTVDRVLRQIRFAPVRLKPSRVNLTPSNELELLCEYDPLSVIGQIFGICSKALACPCGDYGNPFHITLVRGVKFRSDDAQGAYFEKMAAVVDRWRAEYPDGVLFNDGGLDLFANREEILSHYSPDLDFGVQVEIEQLLAMRAQ
ncbi:hypothetical protein [Roseibium sp. M-1]